MACPNSYSIGGTSLYLILLVPPEPISYGLETKPFGYTLRLSLSSVRTHSVHGAGPLKHESDTEVSSFMDGYCLKNRVVLFFCLYSLFLPSKFFGFLVQKKTLLHLVVKNMLLSESAGQTAHTACMVQ